MIVRSFGRRITAFTVSAFALAALAPTSASGQEVVRIANFYSASHPMNIALEEVFVPLVEEFTDGAYVVQVFPDSQLGSERELTEGVRLGSILGSLHGTASRLHLALGNAAP